MYADGILFAHPKFEMACALKASTLIGVPARRFVLCVIVVVVCPLVAVDGLEPVSVCSTSNSTITALAALGCTVCDRDREGEREGTT